MNYKRKHSSKRKFRYLRRGWNGDGKQEIRDQIDRDGREKIIDYFNTEINVSVL